jgi:hypothetical protein
LSGTRLELSSSWTFAAAILALHGAAAASVVAVLASGPGYALAAGLLALGAAAAWGRALHGSTASIRALELAGGELFLELRDGRRLQAELGRGRHVSRLMVTLPVRRPLRRTILISADMLGAEEFRRLRLWALWGRLPQERRLVARKQLPA